MKCMYYMVSDPNEVNEISNHLRYTGISGQLLDTIGGKEYEAMREDLPSGNCPETLDIIRRITLGLGAGLIAGPIAAFYLFLVFGSGLPDYVYYTLAGLIALFGAWEGGLAGSACFNRKMAGLRPYLGTDKYLMLIYVRQSREEVVRERMRRHPSAKLLAVDYFPAPFTPLQHAGANPENRPYAGAYWGEVQMVSPERNTGLLH